MCRNRRNQFIFVCWNFMSLQETIFCCALNSKIRICLWQQRNIMATVSHLPCRTIMRISASQQRQSPGRDAIGSSVAWKLVPASLGLYTMECTCVRYTQILPHWLTHVNTCTVYAPHGFPQLGKVETQGRDNSEWKYLRYHLGVLQYNFVHCVQYNFWETSKWYICGSQKIGVKFYCPSFFLIEYS